MEPRRASSSPASPAVLRARWVLRPCARCARPSARCWGERLLRTFGPLHGAFAILIAPLYGWLVARVPRSVLLPAIYGFMSLAFVGYSRRSSAAMRPIRGWRGCSSWISVMNRCWCPRCSGASCPTSSVREQSKRLFGFIAAGRTPERARAGRHGDVRQVIGNHRPFCSSAPHLPVSIVSVGVLLAQWRSSRQSGVHRVAATSRNASALGGNPVCRLHAGIAQSLSVGHRAVHRRHLGIDTFLYFEQPNWWRRISRSSRARTQVFASLDVTVQTL